jgi:uncharacterized protein (DUF1684 family)
MNKEELIEEIKEIERKVEELKKSVPVHSPKVSMMQELEDLEEKLNAKKKMLSKTENFMEISEWKERLEREREEKDKFFLLHPQSPIPFEERKRFKGLDCYLPNPNYRFELELYEHDEKKTVKMAYTKRNEQDFLRWGEFQFRISGQEQVLQAYKSNPIEDRLFIPFKDETSGKETYGAGRYIDLESERDRIPEGRWILDFNKAYNPWCVYSEAYTCPFVPPENWLKVPIRAGEKNYPLKSKVE